MDLRSDFPFWLLRHGIIQSYPSLSKNTRAGVVVIGAGISGALTAWYLCQAGLDVTIVDRRHTGMGSTAASTGLLQYEIDTPLVELKRKTGEKNATRSYLLCMQAIDEIERLCKKIGVPEAFSSKPSFQFASSHKDVKPLFDELKERKKAGIPVHWMDRDDITKKYGFSKPAGLFSENGGEIDAYLLTHALLRNAASKGLRVYDHTNIKQIRHYKKHVELVSADSFTITARKLVIACGYECQQYLPVKVQKLHSTYSIASEQLPAKKFWYRNSLIWETANPYLYLRTTSDNRILIGGKDIPIADPVKRDRLLHSKSKSLERAFRQLFPSIPFKTDFRWAGIFAATKDGLPYIGSIRQRPNTWFALGFGGNGITFSIVAARIIRDLIQQKNNNDAGLFSFDR